MQGHTSCVTEEQKYAGGATKPGGFAANGFVGDDAPKSTSDVVGSEFLSSGPRWRCSICKVDCTSEATLLSHATGQKHQRRCRAAAAATAAAQGAPAPAEMVCFLPRSVTGSQHKAIHVCLAFGLAAPELATELPTWHTCLAI